MRYLRRLDPVAAAADRGEVQVLGRVDGDLVAADRPPSEAAGVRWRSKADMAEFLPYELKRGGDRPGPAEMWEEFDAAFERLSITATGTEIVAVAYVFREVWDALRTVADELDGAERSRVDSDGGRVVSEGPEGV